MKIKESKLIVSKKNLIDLLKKENLLDEINYSIPNSFDKNKFSKEFLQLSQKGNYKEVYDCAMRNKDYDFKLNDNSIMQFTFEKDNTAKIVKIRYAFYKCPYLILKNETIDETDCWQEDYVSIRYDYDLYEYKEIVHPVSHFHIGNDNNLRIPIDKIIEPLEFGLFVIRNIYLKKWEAIISDEKIKGLYIRNKENLEKIDNDFFSYVERGFLHLE